jgi:hypothetical protein
VESSDSLPHAAVKDESPVVEAGKVALLGSLKASRCPTAVLRVFVSVDHE